MPVLAILAAVTPARLAALVHVDAHVEELLVAVLPRHPLLGLAVA